MHQSSVEKVAAFRERYLRDLRDTPLVVLDLGSQDVNGTYRAVFDVPKWKYLGMDMVAGKNVDIVLSNPYRFDSIRSSSVDVVVSGQAFEHIEYFWLTMLEVARVLKRGGMCCIVAPSGGPEHRYPVDCWRFYPDGMRALARYARLELLDATTQWSVSGYDDGSNDWRDSILIGRKPRGTWFQAVRSDIAAGVRSWVLSRLL